MEQRLNATIYVLHYKDGEPFPELPCYKHIWSGKNNKLTSTLLIGDDTADNISHKNKYYSELTGIYWIWKNQKADIVGTCHYRRFYTNSEIPLIHRIKQSLYWFAGLKRKRKGLLYTSNALFWGEKILNCAEIEQLMNYYDAILPQHRTLKYSVETHYSRYHNIDDIRLIKQIIKELFPDYKKSFDSMLQQKRLYANNMFVLKWEKFEQLAEWLFTILGEFEKRSDLGKYTDYQQRITGFLSERLITTWFLHENLKVKELPLIYLKHFKKK